MLSYLSRKSAILVFYSVLLCLLHILLYKKYIVATNSILIGSIIFHICSSSCAKDIGKEIDIRA